LPPPPPDHQRAFKKAHHPDTLPLPHNADPLHLYPVPRTLDRLSYRTGRNLCADTRPHHQRPNDTPDQCTHPIPHRGADHSTLPGAISNAPHQRTHQCS
jgi:hypothetical protein